MSKNGSGTGPPQPFVVDGHNRDGSGEVDEGTAGAYLVPIADPALTAFGLLHETHSGLIAEMTPDLEAHGVNMSTLEVMLRLARSPGLRLRMAELTAQCTITSSGVTRVVDRLEASGHVMRETCEADRRGLFAVLTETGLIQLQRLLPAHRSTLDRYLISVLTDDELAAFLAILRKLRHAISPDDAPSRANAVQ